jgi:hypothetical protein
MKKTLVILFCFISSVQIGGQVALAIYYGDVGPPGSNEVQIAKVGVIMPLGKILLARKGTAYCAIKFIKFWTGKTEEDFFARYESYYQDDGTGDFSSRNVKYKEAKLSFPKPRGIGRFAFSFGNRNICCGSLRLQWAGEGSVFFYAEGQDQGDYGIELAPTPWTDISQVNVRDFRIKWYRYDENRKRVNTPIDKLWEGNQNKK